MASAAGHSILPGTPSSWASRIIARRRAVLVVALAITVISLLGLSTLRLDASVLSLLPAGSPAADDYRLYVEHFLRAERVPVLVQGDDAAEVAGFADVLARRLATQPAIAAVERGTAPARWRAILARGDLARLLPVEAHAAVAERLTPASIDAALIGARRVLALPGSAGVGAWVAADPLGLTGLLAQALGRGRRDAAIDPRSGRPIAADGRAVLLLVETRDDGFELAGARRIAAALATAEREACAETGCRSVGQDELRVAERPNSAGGGQGASTKWLESGQRLTGRPGGESVLSGAGPRVAATGAFAYSLENEAMFRRDLALYGTLSLLGVALIFSWGLGRVRLLGLVLPPVLAAGVVTLAIGRILYGPIDALALASTAIFLGLGTDAAVHLCARAREELAACGDVAAALERALLALVWPTLLTAATTTAAFGLLQLSSLPAIAQLGVLNAVGMVVVTAATLLVLPALLCTWPPWAATPAGAAEMGSPRWLERLAELARRRRRAVLGALAMALLAAIWIVVRDGVFDGRLDRLLPPTEAARVQAELVALFGRGDPDGAVVIDSGDERGEAALEAVLERSEAVTTRLGMSVAKGDIKDIFGPAALLPSRREQARRLAAWQRLPLAAAAARLSTGLVTQGFAPGAFAPVLAALRTQPEPLSAPEIPLPGLEALRQQHLVRQADGRVLALVAFEPRDRAALLEIAPGLRTDFGRGAGPRVAVTGRSILEEALDRGLRREARMYLLALLVALVALLLGRGHGRRAVLLAVLVPVASLLLTLAILRLLGRALDPVSIAVVPLVLGIGIDDAIFALERGRELGDVTAAIIVTGRALLVTTLTTVVGFAALGLSLNPALAGFGIAGAVGLMCCLVLTIVLLPAGTHLPDAGPPA